jgi:predicted nucleotidyltransferase
MALMLRDLQAQRSNLLAVARRHGASHVRVFGSVARDTSDEASDLDLLVDLELGRTLLDLVALEQELSSLLGCRVDVATSLRPSLRRRVEHEAVAL